jgi:hypothetical protein
MMQMQLFVRLLDGKTKVFMIDNVCNVLDLKQKIQDEENILIEEQKLFYCSKVLNNDLLIADAGINNNSTITLMMGLKGGTGANVLPPIRCFSCGNVIGSKHFYFTKKLKENGHGRIEYFSAKQHGKSYVGKLLDEMGITMPCCRREFITQLR